MIAGQGGELTVSNVASGEAFDTSELTEYGIKGQLLDDRLYFSLSMYEQERTDFSAQSIVTNQAVSTEGTEFEVRWSVNEQLAGWDDLYPKWRRPTLLALQTEIGSASSAPEISLE